MTENLISQAVGMARVWPADAARAQARRDRWAADLLGTAAIASLVFVVFIWVRDQGVASLFYAETVAGSLGLLTGLVSAALMLVQTVMLARIPWVERAWGHDLLARRHKLAGYWSFWLMIAHLGLFAVQRVQRDPDAAWSAIAQLFVLDPWMLWASIGTAMIIGTVATSIAYARRRLRYESWHLLHLYAYLGMAFALPHMIADGSDFHSAFMQIYWWAIYGVTLAVIVIFRVAWPLQRSWRHQLRVESLVEEAPGVVSIAVRGRALETLHTRSGQFFIWRFLGSPGFTRGHPYTISAAPTPDRLRVTVQAVGDGSARALTVKPGSRVIVEGPYGTMTQARRSQEKVLLMAAGVGITPIRALIEDMDYRAGEAALIYRYSSEQHLIFRKELDELAARRGLTVHYLPGRRAADGSWQAVGSDVDDLTALIMLVPDAADRDVFLCGPPPWLHAVKRALRRAGTPGARIHSEDFAW